MLRDLLIVQLGIAGLGYTAIRQIARCDNNRVARILKHIKAARRLEDAKERR